MELILYTSNSTGVASNCLYPNRAVMKALFLSVGVPPFKMCRRI